MWGSIAGALFKVILGKALEWFQRREETKIHLSLGRERQARETAEANLRAVAYAKATEDVLDRMARREPDAYRELRNAFRRADPADHQHLVRPGRDDRVLGRGHGGDQERDRGA